MGNGAASEAPVGSPGPLGSKRGILAVLGQFAGLQVVLALTGVVRNKIVAYRLGPALFGEFAQLASVTWLVSTLVWFGMAFSLARCVSVASDPRERDRLLANANGLVLSLAAVAVVVLAGLLLGGRLLPLVGLASTPVLVAAALILAVTIPLEALRTNYVALLQGIVDVRGMATSRAAAVIVATTLAAPVAWFLGIVGAALQALLLSAFVAALLGWRVRAQGFAPLGFRLERDPLRLLASFGAVAVAGSVATQLAETAIRARLIESAGAAAAGVLQAPLLLSQTVKDVVLGGVGSVVIIAIAPKTEAAEISAGVEQLLDVVVPVAALVIGALGLLGLPALTLLYSGKFAPGAVLFPFILSANLLVVVAWVLGAPQIARSDRMLLVGVESVQAALRCGVSFWLIPRWGAMAVALANLVGGAGAFLLNLAAYRMRYRLRLGARHLGGVLVALALVTLLALAGSQAPGLSPWTFAAWAAWAAYGAYHARRSGAVGLLLARVRSGRGGGT